MRHFVAGVLALCLASAAYGEGKPRIAVVPFTGPQAKSAEAVVVRTLRRKATLIPPSSWQKSAIKLFAKTHSPDDVASVAEDVGAALVITGVVKRDGRQWQLNVSVRDGKSGRSHDKLKYPLRGPRVTESTLTLLAQEIDAAFEHTLAAANADEPESQPQQPPPRTIVKTKPAPVDTTGDDTNVTDDSEPPPVHRPPPVATLESHRPRWAYYLDGTVGATVSGRSFDFDPSSQPRFKSGVVGGIRVDLTLYPLAFTWRKAAGVFATLGLGVTLQKPFWLDSKARDDPSQHFPTTELQVEGGLRWRFVLYKKLPRPELTILAGGGLHSFSISKEMGMDVGPPDVDYRYLAVGGALRLHFAEWASLWAQATYHVVFSNGAVSGPDEFGPGSSYGLRAGGGLDFLVWRGLKVGALGYYERYVLAFSGGGVPQKVASSAIDQYFGGSLVVGYVF